MTRKKRGWKIRELNKRLPEILHRFGVDKEVGFLPCVDPVTRLPERYDAWESIAHDLPNLISEGDFRKRIDTLPIIEFTDDLDSATCERAMQLLSFFAHAYVHSPPEPVSIVPESVAVPWVQLSRKLMRKPILSHASLVLYNWKRVDQDKPPALGNLDTLCQFLDVQDERWFYLVTVEVERVGAGALVPVIRAMEHVEFEEYDEAAKELGEANKVLAKLPGVIKRMYEGCDPDVFYHKLRPFLASFDKVEYRGTRLRPQSHHGGSAAQSSLLQFFDSALGIAYDEMTTWEYLMLMRTHMVQGHAEFLFFTDGESKIKLRKQKSMALGRAYDECVGHLIDFRNEHLKMVARYIMSPAKRANAHAVGTGGTNPMVFLKSVRNQNVTEITSEEE